MKNVPKIPVIIGVIFILALGYLIHTTLALKKTELTYLESQIEGKYKDKTGKLVRITELRK